MGDTEDVFYTLELDLLSDNKMFGELFLLKSDRSSGCIDNSWTSLKITCSNTNSNDKIYRYI